MLRMSLSLVAGLVLLGVVSCLKCPDGKQCSGTETCCHTTRGYSCCPYPDAVCCADMVHCCPSGYTCDLPSRMCKKQNLPWFNMPMVRQEKEKSRALLLHSSAPRQIEDIHVPAEDKSSDVYCDSYYHCPSGTTCCRTLAGTWSCCPYSPGSCCLDGYHCCPMGYHCDSTYQHCFRQSLRYAFIARERTPGVPAAPIVASEERRGLQEKPLAPLTEISNNIQEVAGVMCDFTFSCPEGTTCCKGPQGQWSCCPF